MFVHRTLLSAAKHGALFYGRLFVHPSIARPSEVRSIVNAAALSAPPWQKDVKARLANALNASALTCRQRNAFEQQTLPVLSVLAVSADGRQCRFAVEVTQAMCHYRGGMLHGGVVASLMLDATALQASVVDEFGRQGLSASSSFVFLRPARVGEELELTTEILHSGRTTMTAVMKLFNVDGVPIASGTHTLIMKVPQEEKGDRT